MSARIAAAQLHYLKGHRGPHTTRTDSQSANGQTSSLVWHYPKMSAAGQWRSDTPSMGRDIVLAAPRPNRRRSRRLEGK
jgi:hypothetical protein